MTSLLTTDDFGHPRDGAGQPAAAGRRPLRLPTAAPRSSPTSPSPSPRGASLALIGESGSGKSTIARSVLRLLPRDLGRSHGSIQFNGQEILRLPERQFRRLRGRELGFIPQDPTNSFNHVRTIGAQTREATDLLDDTLSSAERKDLVLDTFCCRRAPPPAPGLRLLSTPTLGRDAAAGADRPHDHPAAVPDRG